MTDNVHRFLCIASYEKGHDFLRQCAEMGVKPTLLTADKLRDAVPAPGSAVVLVANAGVIDEMLGAFELDGCHVTRRMLTQDELAGLDVALSDTPPAHLPSDDGRSRADSPRPR